MGADEIFTVLKEAYPKWLSSEELSEIIDVGQGSCANVLRKLRNHNEVRWKAEDCRKKKGATWHYVYQFKE